MSPLSDLIVVEHGNGVGIRYAGRLFAELGARVLRPSGPGPTTIGYGGKAGEAYSAWLDAGKETADHQAPDLVIVDEGTASTVDATFVAALNWFAPGGPYSDWIGTDAVIQALAGHVFPFGPQDGPPAVQQGDTPQIIAGVTLCIAALAGLIGRRAGAGPARVETNVFEAMMCLSEVVPMVYDDTGVVAGRRGINRFFPTFPGNCWQASDGWIGITTLTPPQWRGLCEMVGHPEMASDPDFATTELRIERADQIEELFAPRILEKPVSYWVTEGQARRVPFVSAPRPAELLDDPHWQQRGSFPEQNGHRAPRLPYRITQGAPGKISELSPTAEKPLAGLRVMDLSMGWSGPLATRHLGGLGAEIVKVESRAHPDWWRGWNGPESDAYAVERRRDFAGMNTNKQAVLLDLTSAEDAKTAKALARFSDVMIENYATGVIDKLGFGHSTLQQAAPGIVSVSMALFGAYGPNAGYRGYGSTTDHASGLPFVHGAADWPPAQCHIAIGDAVAGLFSAIAALAGIWGRPKHGGAYFDLSQIECMFQFTAPAILAEQVTGQPVFRDAVVRPCSELTLIIAGKGSDAWLLIDCETPEQHQMLQEYLGCDARALEGEITEWAASRVPADAATELQQAGIPAAPVQSPHLLGQDRHLNDTGFWVWRDREHVGRHLLAHSPYRLDGIRPAIEQVAPTMGEHDHLLAPLRTAEATV